jgi:hypothetical protein
MRMIRPRTVRPSEVTTASPTRAWRTSCWSTRPVYRSDLDVDTPCGPSVEVAAQQVAVAVEHEADGGVVGPGGDLLREGPAAMVALTERERIVLTPCL